MSFHNKLPPQSGDEIRKAFLDFYKSKSHKVIPSASLIPDDPTVLLTIAGMLPFKSVFLGLTNKPSDRATTSQKCIRTNDIENVGVTARHHTFFEMLGNFSFGDYFKTEAIQWAWELVTSIYKLKKENIIITVFYEDQESEIIWRDQIGVDPAKIIKLKEDDNFWSSGPTGPCGPCSEMYYDFHPDRGTENIDLEDDERFIEFYNLVFMQYNRDSAGKLTNLATKNIDTGMGLERMSQILQKKESNYETDLIYPIIQKASQLTNINYFSCGQKQQTSLKILGDHTRAIIHLISDGVVASNLGRGYILRRLLRRMVRHGKLLGIKKVFISELAIVGIEIMKNSYPDLRLNFDRIIREINLEESRFLDTLERGEKLLNELIASERKIISGLKAFELYDTYGFPLELTVEILREKNINVDLQGFDEEMKKQKMRAKAASQSVDLTLQGSIERDIDLFVATKFNGYEILTNNSVIKGIFVDSKSVKKVEEGQEAQIILNQTSFYGESGGQVSDKGIIENEFGKFIVDKVIRKKGVFLHCGISKKGDFHVGQQVETIVDKTRRVKAQSNHTATHLLQSALKIVLDQSVGQRGSLVAFNKLRFDFNFTEPISVEQISRIENLVNQWIIEDHPIEVKIMEKDKALKLGALAMFGEKYSDIVRVVDVPGISLELCGGTHVQRTSELGCFKIINQLGISAGIRRIEALSGQSVLEYLSERNSVINQLSDLLKTNPKQIYERVSSLQSEIVLQNKEINQMKLELSKFKSNELLSQVETVSTYRILITQLNGLGGDLLQSAALDLVMKLGSKALVILGGIPDQSGGKALFVASLGSDIVQQGLHAGKLINDIARICSGGGGGKANIAQAGAKNINKLDEALVFARSKILSKLNIQLDK
tara:strand:+ start:134 stop:2794 length:2661 start_codon:yes stop_codon:yes gene_type:complete